MDSCCACFDRTHSFITKLVGIITAVLTLGVFVGLAVWLVYGAPVTNARHYAQDVADYVRNHGR